MSAGDLLETAEKTQLLVQDTIANNDSTNINVDNEENNIKNIQIENRENLQTSPTDLEVDEECPEPVTNLENIQETDITCTAVDDCQKKEECNTENKTEDIEYKNIPMDISLEPPDDITETTESNSQENILQTPSKSPRLHNDLKSEDASPNRNLESCTKERRVKRKLQTPSPTKYSTCLTDVAKNMHNSPKRRKVSINNDYRNMCDTIKPEIYEAVNINDIEPMNFLHDLDTLIEFEDCKISEDILLSSMICDNVAQDSTGDNISVDKEQPSDPLCLEENAKKKNIDDPKRKPSVEMKRSKSPLLDEEVKQDVSETVECIKVELETIKEKEEFPQSVINSLKELKVKLIHEVPPQHKIERNAGSHVPSQEEKRIFYKYGPLRKGKFSPAEDNTIIENWKMFCKLHDWDEINVEPFLYMRHNGKYYIHQIEERQKFVQFLANGLPWRSLYSVYTRFKCLHQGHKNQRNHGKYSPEEDRKIIAYMQDASHNQNTKCSELAKILGRTRHSVWLHYQLLKEKGKCDTMSKVSTEVKWTLPLIKKFIRHLLDLTLSETVDELKDAIIPKPVWVKLEKVLHIDAVVLKKFWLYQLHMQLFCPEPIYLNDIKIQLIEYMYGKGVGHIREIIWPNVARYFDGMTSVFLCRIFFHLLRDCDMKITANNLFDVLEYLYYEVIPQIQEEHMDKVLPRLRYRNKNVKLVDNHED